MRIQNILIQKSPVHDHAWVMHIEVNDCKFSGYFDNFGGFITAVTEAAKFFAVRAGKLRVKDANLTRVVVPGDGRANVLPGDRAQ